MGRHLDIFGEMHFADSGFGTLGKDFPGTCIRFHVRSLPYLPTRAALRSIPYLPTRAVRRWDFAGFPYAGPYDDCGHRRSIAAKGIVRGMDLHGGGYTGVAGVQYWQALRVREIMCPNPWPESPATNPKLLFGKQFPRKTIFRIINHQSYGT